MRSILPRQKGKAPCGLLAASRLPWDTRSQTQHLEPHQELGCSFLVARGGLEMFSGKTSCLVYPDPFSSKSLQTNGEFSTRTVEEGSLKQLLTPDNPLVFFLPPTFSFCTHIHGFPHSGGTIR